MCLWVNDVTLSRSLGCVCNQMPVGTNKYVFFQEQLKEKQVPTIKTMKVNKEGNHSQRHYHVAGVESQL